MSPRDFADGLVRGRLPNLSGSELADIGRELQAILDDRTPPAAPAELSDRFRAAREALLETGLDISTADVSTFRTHLAALEAPLYGVRKALADLGALMPDDYDTDLGALIGILFAALK